MVFPHGITGFNVPKGHPPVDPVRFQRDCRQIVRPLAGQVQERPQVPAAEHVNFLTLVLVTPYVEVTALLNRHYPWLGFCRPLEPGTCSLDFVDPGRLADSFAALGRYRILAQAELDQPVTDAICAELGRGELQQLKYWSKGRGRLRVGEIVFNFWD